MKPLIVFAAIALGAPGAFGQSSPKTLIHAINKKFTQVKDYSAALRMEFDIPSVKLTPVEGAVYFKQPDKFRVKTEGIIFLPKQNPYFTLQSIRDTNTYTAIFAGEETVQSAKTQVVNVIPNDNAGELILAKLWIDPARKLILRSQLTTKSSGTLTVEQGYGRFQGSALPDWIRFTIDVARFKVPKSVAVDLSASKNSNGLPARGTGTIQLFFSNYKLNQNLSDAVFSQGELSDRH